jgi:O-antigen/teichoic acid export membrane protein
VEVIPKYGKWAPALIPLAFLALNTVFASVTTQLTNLLNAIGKIKVTFKLMIMWTVLTWALVPILSIKFGVIGAAMAYALVGASSVIAIYIARKYVKFSLSDSVLGPGVAAAIMSVTLLLVKNLLPTNLMAVWILIIVGAVSYFLAIYLIVGVSIIADVKKSFSTLFSK